MNYQKLEPSIIQLEQKNQEIKLLWLYGSQAQGTAHEGSDIDLAIVFKTWEHNVVERRLRPELLAIA